MVRKVKPRGRGRPRVGLNAFGVWLDAVGINRDDAAKQLSLSRGYLDKLCRNARRPDLELALRIERLTRGEIPVAFWLNAPRHTGD